LVFIQIRLLTLTNVSVYRKPGTGRPMSSGTLALTITLGWITGDPKLHLQLHLAGNLGDLAPEITPAKSPDAPASRSTEGKLATSKPAWPMLTSLCKGKKHPQKFVLPKTVLPANWPHM
jgi:hypothetical protein